MTTTTPTLNSLPVEIKNNIFQFVNFPLNLSKLNKTFNEISKNDNIRFSWLKTKYGKDAIEACSFHLNIVSKNTFAKLLSQTNIPRYVLQRSFIRLIKKNRHDLIIILLNRGSELYADLSLNSLDTDRFKEIYTRAGSFNTFFQLFNPNGHAAIDENSEALKLLVTENNFDLNYCKWNSHTGVSNLKVCEGYKHFLTVIQSKGISLIKEMLQYGVIPYISESSPVEIPSVPFDPFNAIDQHSHVNVGSDRELAPIWITSIFPSDLHPYLTKTCDAIVLATKLKSAEIVKILLEFDLERWNSNHGKKVLKDCLQLAVDIDWKVGEKLINDYSGNHEKPSKSEAALRKMLLDACKCACFDDVKSLLEEGATFMIDGNFRHLSWWKAICDLVTANNVPIIKYLVLNYFGKHDFVLQILDELLALAIDNRRINMSLLLIDLSMIYFKNGKPTILSVKMLRKSLVKNLNQVTRKILDHLHQQNPFKLVSNLNSIIKMLDKKGNEDEYQGAKIAVCGYVFLVKCSRDEAERSGRKLAATSKADLTIFEWGARSMNEGNGMSVELIERLNHELMGLEPPRKRRKGKKVKHEDDDDEDYE